MTAVLLMKLMMKWSSPASRAEEVSNQCSRTTNYKRVRHLVLTVLSGSLRKLLLRHLQRQGRGKHCATMCRPDRTRIHEEQSRQPYDRMQGSSSLRMPLRNNWRLCIRYSLLCSYVPKPDGMVTHSNCS